MRRLRTMVLLVLALAHLALGGLGGSTVLCIEAGGRVSVESVGTLCCDEDAESPAQHETPTVGSADCCSCIDVPLHGDGAAATEQPTPLVRVHLALIAIVAPTLSMPFAPVRETRVLRCEATGPKDRRDRLAHLRC